MCGIIFVHRFDKIPARRLVLKRYDKQKMRGQDGYGYIGIQNWQLGDWWRAEDEKAIRSELEKEESQTILFHHRMPTSTPNYIEATHPIKVDNESLKYKYYLAHNGMIHNDLELKKNHNKLGFVYNTEFVSKLLSADKRVYYTGESCWNDSEALAIDLALVIENKQKEMEARGSIAFVMLQVDKKTNRIVQVFYGRNLLNPLRIDKNGEFFFSISSEGQGTEVPVHKLFSYDPAGNTHSSIEMDIGANFTYVPPKKDHGTGYKSDPDYYPVNNKLIALPETTTFFGKDEEDDFSFDYDDYLIQLYEDREELVRKLKFATDHNFEKEMIVCETEIASLDIEIQNAELLADDELFKTAVEKPIPVDTLFNEIKDF